MVGRGSSSGSSLLIEKPVLTPCPHPHPPTLDMAPIPPVRLPPEVLERVVAAAARDQEGRRALRLASKPLKAWIDRTVTAVRIHF